MPAPHYRSGGVLAPLSHWRPDEAASDGAMQRAIRRVVHPAGLSYRRVGCRSKRSAVAPPLYVQCNPGASTTGRSNTYR
jgi:hypothetical protein